MDTSYRGQFRIFHKELLFIDKKLEEPLKSVKPAVSLL
jgi:hypothetical protein